MTWHTSQGNADLKSTFGANRHDLNVSTHQMCILLLYNNADTLSYAEIAEATQASYCLLVLVVGVVVVVTAVMVMLLLFIVGGGCGGSDGRDGSVR